VPSQGALGAGQSLAITVFYDCSQANSFLGSMVLEATQDGQTTTVTEPLAANLSARVVVLDVALGPFPQGSQIELNRIGNKSELGAHPPNCGSVHLHALSAAGITIDGIGPFPDPATMGCGYGSIVTVPR
jgi:hypothetical protein